MQSARFLIAAVTVGACAAQQPSHLARGLVGLDAVSSTVDSELAGYYATHYLTGRGADPIRDRQLDELLAP
jgi:hypothetical protein